MALFVLPVSASSATVRMLSRSVTGELRPVSVSMPVSSSVTSTLRLYVPLRLSASSAKPLPSSNDAL